MKGTKKNTKEIVISESDLKHIIRESVEKAIKEGIDVRKDKETGERFVSVNPTHQNMVDTNDPYNPYLFVSEVSFTNDKGETVLSPVYSMAERKFTEDGRSDGNPLISALKQRRNWKFEDEAKDIQMLLRSFIAAAKLLPKYDTLIMTPSNNRLNKIVFGYLSRLIPHDNAIDNFFVKYSADDVEDNFVDEDYIDSQPDSGKIWTSLEDAFDRMRAENGGVFSYKYIQVSRYRNAIKKSIAINSSKAYDTYYEQYINGKNVLVFDDTITSGKTISDSGKAITETFIPRTITFVTLFSALSTDGGMKKTNSIPNP